MDDFQSVLARLGSYNQGQQQGAQEQQQQQQQQQQQPGQGQHNNYHQPSVSSPVYTPQLAGHGGAPRQAGDVISPNTSVLNTPSHEQSGSGSYSRNPADLLGLLRSRQSQTAQNQAAASSPSQPPSYFPSGTNNENVNSANRPVSAADLVAGFTRKPSTSSVHSPLVAPAQSRPDLRGEAASGATNPQDFLLKLLAQGKPESGLGQQQQRAPEASTHQGLGFAQQPQSTMGAFPSQYTQGILPGFTRSSDDAAKYQQTQGQKSQDEPRASESIFGKPDASPATSHTFGQHPSDQSTAFSPPQQHKPNPFTYTNPFEQLSAASPSKQSKPISRTASPHIDMLKHARDVSKGISPGPASKTAKHTSTDSPGKTTSSTPAPETVAEAVTDIGDKVDKQLEQGLAKLQLQSSSTQDVESTTTVLKSKKVETPSVPEESGDSPKSDADGSSVAADWEDEADAKEPKPMQVYVFPMKPFVSIQIELEKSPLSDASIEISESNITNVARMRKDFDQLDRNLVASSSRFIVYALKSGGLRLIRQDSGKFKQLFQTVEERIFNIVMSSSRFSAGKSDVETVLATGIKGTAFWAPLANFGGNNEGNSQGIEDERGFIFPPVSHSEEQTSSGQLKTRVKASSRTPDFFAYGRGKNIHIIWPALARSSTYTDPKTKVCNSEKYLREDDLKISTGKAAKDFTFSSDDTVVASLDKAGKLKFWDVRPLTKPEFNSEFRAGTVAEVKTPILTLNTTSPNEKSWPTSVMFIDKEKPMTRGAALRYMVIGQKQNHSIQLWDLALGKPVQEINFPHSDESDAICSLAFNARYGILAVGHPTRNSIFLLHVSPPKYSMPQMSQAKFMSMIAAKDKTLPAVTSTVIVSSIREFGLGSRGQLRSMELMIEPSGKSSEDDSSSTSVGSVMTLICMHSKGIFEFGVTRQHLGWTPEGKTINPVDAVESGAITLSAFRPPPQDETPPQPEQSSRSTSKEDLSVKPVKETQPKPEAQNGAKRDVTEAKEAKPAAAAPVAPVEKEKKKKNKKGDGAGGAKNTPPAAAKGPLHAVQKPAQETRANDSSIAPAGSNGGAYSDDVQRLELNLTNNFNSALGDQFDLLYRRIADDKRVADSAGSAKQDALLRLVSTTLEGKLEPLLSKSIKDSLTEEMKSAKEVLGQSADRSITTAFGNAVRNSLPREMEKVLTKSFNDGPAVRNISEATSKQTAAAVQRLVPTTQDIQAAITDSNRALTAQFEKRLAEQAQKAELQRKQDSEKIDRLTAGLNTLLTAFTALAEQSLTFQSEIRENIQNQATSAALAVASPPVAATPSRAIPKGHQRDASNVSLPGPSGQQQGIALERQPSPGDEEVANIRNALAQGRHEEAFVLWLQSTRQGDLFDLIFVRINPSYLEHASSLVALSITAAVTFTLAKNLNERLDWLEVALSRLDPANADFFEDGSILPRIMEVIFNRLRDKYEQIVAVSQGAAVLQRISYLGKRAVDLKRKGEGSLGR